MTPHYNIKDDFKFETELFRFPRAPGTKKLIVFSDDNISYFFH